MPTLTATYLDDLGRVRLQAGDLDPNVVYSIQRQTAVESAWVDVRGAQSITDGGTTMVDDYEYTPNVVNTYRITGPLFYDSFMRSSGPGGLVLTGAAGGYASTADKAALDITGDIDLRGVVNFPNYATGAVQTIGAKWDATADQRSYGLRILNTGAIQLLASVNGTGTISPNSTVTLGSVGVEGGQTVAVRATRVAATGATTFYYSVGVTVNPPVWTQLGTTVAATSGNLFAGTAVLEIGSITNGTTSRAVGTVLSFQVRNGINGTAVANPSFVSQPTGTLSFADTTGNTWNVNGDASILGNDTVWGSADTGQTYTAFDINPDAILYVDNGVGAIADPTPAGDTAELNAPTGAAGVDVEAAYSAIQPAATLDATTEYNVGLRATPDNLNYYESQVFFRTDNQVSIRVSKTIGGVYTALSDTPILGEWTPNVPWHARLQVVGTTVQARAWVEGTTEPRVWQVTATDTDLVSSTGVNIRARKASGAAYEQWFGPIEVNTMPETALATASVTPVQEETMLKSVQFPSLNKALDCVNWDALNRRSRAGFFDIKGRHEILGITDMGSTATFNLTFLTHSKAENRAVVALLTYGGTLLLQPPGDDDTLECQSGTYSGTPAGYVVPGNSVQAHALPGQALWSWTVTFTQVAAPSEDITPTTITWQQLWDIIGPDGTWEDVWATWPTWQALWNTTGSIDAFFQN